MVLPKQVGISVLLGGARQSIAKLRMIDDCFALVRHITTISCWQTASELRDAITKASTSAESGPDFPVRQTQSYEVTAQKHVPQLTVEQVVHVLALRCAGKNVEIAHHVSQEGRSVRFDPTVVTTDILACGEGKWVQRRRGAGPSIMSREENCEILVAPVPHTILQEFMRTCIFGRVDVPTPQTHEEISEVAMIIPQESSNTCRFDRVDVLS